MRPDRPIRLAALYSHPIQYFVPIFRELASRPTVDLTVYFCSRQGLSESFDADFGTVFQWDVPLLDGYRSRFLRNWTSQTRTDGFWRLINPAVTTELVRQRYDALLMHGYEHATKVMALAAAKMSGTPVMLRSDSNLVLPRTASTLAVKRAVLSPALGATAACLYVGTRNHDYYRHYGVAEDRLFFTPYCVDNEYWQRRRAATNDREVVRSRWGVPLDVPVILFVGKLIPYKQPLVLLEAFKRVRERSRCALVYVGDGALRGAIEQAVRDGDIPDVHVAGFTNQTEIASAYAASDVLVLPSVVENWGLAVNEAMNFGLPIVVTDRVGCAGDLVRSGENGFVVAYDRADELAGALEQLVVDPTRRAAFGRRSLAMISAWSVRACVDGILDAAARVAARRA